MRGKSSNTRAIRSRAAVRTLVPSCRREVRHKDFVDVVMFKFGYAIGFADFLHVARAGHTAEKPPGALPAGALKHLVNPAGLQNVDGPDASGAGPVGILQSLVPFQEPPGESESRVYGGQLGDPRHPESLGLAVDHAAKFPQ